MSGRILVIDDDDDVRRVLRLMLENAGYTVSEIPDGRLAVAEAARLLPDLILIDWVMPDLDGLAATAQLKRDTRTAAIPVVMLSAKMNAADRVDALAAGVNDFAAKPFRSADVLEKVRRHIGERHATLVAAPLPGRRAGGAALDLDELIANADAAAARGENAASAATYSLAAEAASDIGDADQANKFLRLAGKMHLFEAEASSDPEVVHDAYRAAARFFLAAGNLALATRANASARAALAGRAQA